MHARRLLLFLLFGALGLAGCAAPSAGGGGAGPPEESDSVDDDAEGSGGAEGTDGRPGFSLTSAGFADGESIPALYTTDGDDLSPPLTFGGVPDGTVELALTVVDPDAPRGTFVHWLIYGMAADTTGLGEGVPPGEGPGNPPGAVQGTNGFGDLGYGGPAPPPGDPSHRYVFTLFALSGALDLEPGADYDRLLETMDGLVIAETELVGQYGR
ncbi:MAG: YbhB/YbcL family Raf kinase inhibitor-like protein [bacterium]|nr:YbhB/YbcL family Raf kinase inhibitor-like protein [bacterium]